MPPRRFTLAAAAALALPLVAAPAQAFLTLSSGGHLPVEQRVVLAVGPDRSTIWTSVRLDATAGPVAIVVPAVPDASLDWSSAAWLEALEGATAPRILPPSGVSPVCPGEPDADPFDVAGDLGHSAPLFPVEVTVLADADAVVAWATQSGLVVSPAAAAALAAHPGPRFVGARFVAPAGPALTPTLRVTFPSASSELPMSLVLAGQSDLLVTTFLVGAGRARIDGAPLAVIDPSKLAFFAADGTSDYRADRAAALAAAGPGAALVEAASHEALVDTVPIGAGSAAIEGVVSAYFERAAAYGDGLADPSSCIPAAAAALASSSAVASSCPRADLGVVDGVDTCSEQPLPGEIDPAVLRCGPGADDLAVALSGLTPAGAWLTRISRIIPATQSGAADTASFPGGAPLSPVLQAASLDLSGCAPAAASSSAATATASAGPSTSATATSSGAGGIHIVRVPVYTRYDGCSCGGTEESVSYVDEEVYDPGAGGGGGAGGAATTTPEAYYYDEDCDGDTSGPYETEPESDGCGSDTSETTDQSSEGCDSDTTSDGSGGTTSDGTTSDGGDATSDSGCGSDTSSDTSDDCALAPRPKPRLRLSALAMLALTIAIPVRRARRRRSRRT